MNNVPQSFASHEEAIAWARKISRKLGASRKWQPLTPTECSPLKQSPLGASNWSNDFYLVAFRKYPSGWPFGGGEWATLGISSHDGHARHDWRDFQRIKNELLGPDWEAIELYPAESRLLDPSNYYILYCAPKIPIGKYVGRTVMNETNCLAPQRPWAAGDEPTDTKNPPAQFAPLIDLV